MRKLKMFGVGLAAAALVFMITAGQWNSDVSKTAGIVSDWLVRGTTSIRDSETAHFVASWVAKETDSIRDSYPTRLVSVGYRLGCKRDRCSTECFNLHSSSDLYSSLDRRVHFSSGTAITRSREPACGGDPPRSA